MVEKVRLGVVGVGAQGRLYAELVASGRVPSLTLAALCSPNPASNSTDRHQQLAGRLGVPLFTDLRQLLDAQQVDAIVICTPHYEHPRIGIEALRSGVHVLVEKPVGVTNQVMNCCRSPTSIRPTLAVMYNQWTNPCAELKQAIDSGRRTAAASTWRSPTGGAPTPTSTCPVACQLGWRGRRRRQPGPAPARPVAVAVRDGGALLRPGAVRLPARHPGGR